MSLHDARASGVSRPAPAGHRPVRLLNPGPERRTATLVVHVAGAEPTAHVVALPPGESRTVPLEVSATATLECHLDGADASAVLTLAADGDGREPLFSLRDSTVVVC